MICINVWISSLLLQHPECPIWTCRWEHWRRHLNAIRECAGRVCQVRSNPTFVVNLRWCFIASRRSKHSSSAGGTYRHSRATIILNWANGFTSLGSRSPPPLPRRKCRMPSHLYIAEGHAILLNVYSKCCITESLPGVGVIVSDTIIIKLHTDGSKSKMRNSLFYVRLIDDVGSSNDKSMDWFHFTGVWQGQW